MNKKLDYYKRIVKRHLSEIKNCIELAKNDMERKYYLDRYAVQLSIYSKALSIRVKYLEKYV